MTREEGYYWVKLQGEWVIGEYFISYAEYTGSYGGWSFTGNYSFLGHTPDSDLEEIDERRIERNAEPAAHKLGYTPDQL